jgi:hypothetical protein
MAAVGALGSTVRLGCLVKLSTQLGRERSSKRSLFKNNLRLLSHTLALITPAYDRREDDVASTNTTLALFVPPSRALVVGPGRASCRRRPTCRSRPTATTSLSTTSLRDSLLPLPAAVGEEVEGDVVVDDDDDDGTAGVLLLLLLLTFGGG